MTHPIENSYKALDGTWSRLEIEIRKTYHLISFSLKFTVGVILRMSKTLTKLCTSFYARPSQCIHATQILNEKWIWGGEGEQ